MTTLTVRIDDETRDLLDELAGDAGMNLSDYIRSLLREAVVPVSKRGEASDMTPETLSPQDRHTLSLLHRILARVLPEDSSDTDGNGEDQLGLARVLEAGFTNEYWVEYAGISEELSKKNCVRVMDILDMFRILDHSIQSLRKDGVELDADTVSRLRYGGFDHNDALEGKMADYVEHLISKDKWTEQADFVNGPRGGNSHMTMLPMYQRMLDEYRRINERRDRVSRMDYELKQEDLTAIADATVHPDNRAAK